MRIEERVRTNPGIFWRISVVKTMPRNKFGLAQRAKNSLTAALGCCINLVLVLFKPRSQQNDASSSGINLEFFLSSSPFLFRC